MKKFFVLYSNKKKDPLDQALLEEHVAFLKKLHKDGSLVTAGPLYDNSRAIMILKAPDINSVVGIIQSDPFIKSAYYMSYEAKEYFEANKQNNWLMDHPQTQASKAR